MNTVDQPTQATRWVLPLALVMLSLVPALQGALRLGELASGVASTAENSRFHNAPWPVVLHIVGATGYCLLGAFQFLPLRGTRRGWHRVAGRLALPLGGLSALSGLWMTLGYPLGPELQGPLLLVARLIVGLGMLVSLTMGWRAALRREFIQHRTWMVWAYALGQGAGTQVLVFMPFGLFQALGWGAVPGGMARDLLMILAWVLNGIWAQWWLRKTHT